ncbi:MAG: hypothetical protein KDG55_04970 [Rhodocyclaceae bacterium]|nr:hypothetical protein [Rhodocyclaceae bacterium]
MDRLIQQAPADGAHGNIPPAEAEAAYYRKLDEQTATVWRKPDRLLDSRCHSICLPQSASRKPDTHT